MATRIVTLKLLVLDLPLETIVMKVVNPGG
jgi:hypothetical protein